MLSYQKQKLVLGAIIIVPHSAHLISFLGLHTASILGHSTWYIKNVVSFTRLSWHQTLSTYYIICTWYEVVIVRSEI